MKEKFHKIILILKIFLLKNIFNNIIYNFKIKKNLYIKIFSQMIKNTLDNINRNIKKN